MSLRVLPELRALWQRAGVQPYPFQLAAAERWLDALGGRGLLADEVGLGKTIEAGLIIRELQARGQRGDILILTPAALVNQWRDELREKFALQPLAHPKGEAWRRAPLLIASLDRAKRPPQAGWLEARSFCLVIVDEAHRLKSRQSRNHRFVASLRARYLLLLTATPLQNDLTELHSLVSLAQPERFGSLDRFWGEFLLDKRHPKDPRALRRALAGVMVRHERRELPHLFPGRRAALLPVRLSPPEAELYEGVSEVLREAYRKDAGGANRLLLLTLLRELCSSPAALARSLGRAGWAGAGGRLGELRALAESIAAPSKAQVLETLLRAPGGPALVFTEFRPTLEALRRFLAARGLAVRVLHGGLRAVERERAIASFRRGEVSALLSTECGGQGLNLQSSRRLINYDLPYPMRVEQRIGRLHRLGQRQDVLIYNLCSEGTVEEAILRLLDEKIDLFRQVVGELDLILRQVERRRSFEGELLEIALSARDSSELNRGMGRLARRLEESRARIERAWRWSRPEEDLPRWT